MGWVHARLHPAAGAAGAAAPPAIARFETKLTLPGPFRVPGPLLPWTFKSHGRAGVPVFVRRPGGELVAAPDEAQPRQPASLAASAAAEEEG